MNSLTSASCGQSRIPPTLSAASCSISAVILVTSIDPVLTDVLADLIDSTPVTDAPHVLVLDLFALVVWVHVRRAQVADGPLAVLGTGRVNALRSLVLFHDG